MKYFIFVIFLLGICWPSSSSHRLPFYRTDYTYFESFDAFYKIHWDDCATSWKTAFSACADEGATLFYPKAEEEWRLVKNLTDSAPEVLNATEIFVGFHDQFKLGEFITVDGHSLPDPLASDSSLLPDPRAASSSIVLDPLNFGTLPLLDENCITMNIDSGTFKVAFCSRTPDTALPFVCKKVEEPSCPTIDHGYKYKKASRKCYKVNKKLKMWQDAMKTCFIEGGILAVIENKAQAEEVRDMVDPRVSYFVGVKKVNSPDRLYYTSESVYYTVKGIFLPVTYSRQVQFYRKDYTYVEQFNAFYKVHRDESGSAWSTALFTCDDEGATLFYPNVEGEWTLVKNLTDKMTKLSNVTDIFVGLHDEFKLGEFMTVDGYPSTVPSNNSQLQENCMTMNIHTGMMKASSCLRTPETSIPFVCKKIDDESCPTIDRGYKYAKASKKCYKVNEKSVMWQDAMKTCFLEGGILAVIEDSAQAEEVRLMLKSRSYFVGVRQLNYDGEFYTVKGQKISDIYQSQDINEGPRFGKLYGTVVNRGNHLYTEKEEAIVKLPFICEMKLAN